MKKRPLSYLWMLTYQIFTNNINGSPGYLHKSLLVMNDSSSISPTQLFADTVPCQVLPAKSTTIEIGRKRVKFQCFLVQFCFEDELQTLPTITLEVHAPFSCTLQNF
jgi:hypothetical protein